MTEELERRRRALLDDGSEPLAGVSCVFHLRGVRERPPGGVHGDAKELHRDAVLVVLIASPRLDALDGEESTIIVPRAEVKTSRPSPAPVFARACTLLREVVPENERYRGVVEPDPRWTGSRVCPVRGTLRPRVRLLLRRPSLPLFLGHLRLFVFATTRA